MMEGTEKVVVGGRSALLDWMTPVTSKVDKRRRRGANNWGTLGFRGHLADSRCCWSLLLAVQPQKVALTPRETPGVASEQPGRKERDPLNCEEEEEEEQQKEEEEVDEEEEESEEEEVCQNEASSESIPDPDWCQGDPEKHRCTAWAPCPPQLASNTGCQLFLSGSPPKKNQKNTPHGQEFLHTITSKYNE